MSAGGWGYAIAAAINGGLKGMQLAKGWEQQEEDAAFQKEERAQKRTAWADASTEKQALKDAAQPIAVQQYTAGQQAVDKVGGAEFGPPQIDVSQVPANPAEPVGFKAGKQSFMDQTAAQRYADEQNTPMGMAQRQVDAYTKIGKPKEAMAISTQILQQQEAQQKQADRQWRDDLGRAMQSGHEGLAKLASASSIGPMTGMSVKLVDNGDGTVSYVSVGADGSAKPIPGIPAFKNDQDGVTQAAYMLDRTITPEQRHAAMLQERQFKQQQSIADRNYQLQLNTQGRQDRLANMQLEESGIKLENLKSDAKIPAAVKAQVQTAQDELKSLNQIIYKAQADGTFQAESPQAKQLMDRQKALSNEIKAALFPYSTKDKAGADPAGWRSGGPATGGGKGAPNSYKDPAWDGYEAEAAKTVGIPTEVLRTARVNGERSNGDQVSSKGARGVYQFIPATRDAVLKKYGYDAYSSDPKEQSLAAAALLKEISGRNGGDWGKTFAGYNGGISGEKGTNPTRENREYVQRTMAGMPSVAGAPRAPISAASGRPVAIAVQQGGDAAAQLPQELTVAQLANYKPEYDKQLKEMSHGSRLRFEGDAALYAHAIDASKQRESVAASKKERDEELRKEQAKARALSPGFAIAAMPR